MILLLLIAVAISGLTGANLPAQTKSLSKSKLSSPFHLIAQIKSGIDYKNRPYISYRWYLRNVSAGDVWLPLPKERWLAAAAPPRYYRSRARVPLGWTSPPLAEHEVDYEAECESCLR